MIRRHFMHMTSLAVVAPVLSSASRLFQSDGIACQQYPWHTFFERTDRDWQDDLAYSVQQVLDAGFSVFEPLISSLDYLQQLVKIIGNDLSCPSLYVNSTLHDEHSMAASMEEVMGISRAAQEAWGTKIIVTNPSPIAWGGSADKTDSHLKTQANALNQLGHQLHREGMSLAYHNHDAEMRNSAREFHHMMLGTDPTYVHLCLDSHWIYRGAGDSHVALFDIIKLYLDRVVELHLRQSQGGIWTEYFQQQGDIDYAGLASLLAANDMRPHLVLEQAIEMGSPQDLSPVEAHRASKTEADKFF